MKAPGRALKRWLSKSTTAAPLTVIPRDQHNISRSQLSENALKVLYRLHKAGYQALLVGGGVRDTLLGLEPKDFDVATNATPEQVAKLFRNSRLIGRRFKLVHVVFGREVIEVATFRAPPQAEHSSKQASTGDQGMILRDNVYGNKDEDAMRRDFTVNALYYDIADFSVHAYAGGWQDLQHKRLRLIGEPEVRYREDPVRMLRAVRFAAKLGFSLEQETERPIQAMAPLLQQIPPARLFEEVLKLFLHGQALQTFEQLQHYGLFAELFPQTAASLLDDAFCQALVSNTFANTDARIQSGKSVTPYFFLASLLWPAVCQRMASYEEQGMPPQQALHKAADKVIAQQAKSTAIPKRLSIPMREIWELQLRLPKIRSRRCKELLGHPRFRAAYDFVLLREQSGEQLDGLGQWWTDFQAEHGPVVTNRPRDERNREDGRNDRPRRRPNRRRKPPRSS
ncbi:poly(A) polymerase [Bacterioplanes sanyensis]|uniref:Poly(A) polymerase I n=1 Tax=Bacterioplanes sanyensis TaxID=1249553 RepID=A0A222FRH1_9GAMM|nr:poly(A) polymerase [Bacterioplanes sanyensis]